MNKQEYRRSSIMFPLILISIGVLLLLSNMNVLEFDVWNMISKYWPIIIIGMGLEIFLGRRVSAGQFIIIGLVILFAFNSKGQKFIFSDEDVITEHISVNMPDSDLAEIDINFGVGQVSISAMDNEEKLLTGELDVLEGYELKETFSEGDIFHYSLGFDDGYQGIPFDVDGDITWDIQISEDIPIVLSADAGVGQVTMNLETINLVELDLNMGIGQVILYLPETGDYEVDIDGGIGQLVIYVPEGLGARIIVETGLGNIDVDSEYSHSGNVYTNEEYATSENRVDLRVSAGIGSIEISEGN